MYFFVIFSDSILVTIARIGTKFITPKKRADKRKVDIQESIMLSNPAVLFYCFIGTLTNALVYVLRLYSIYP